MPVSFDLHSESYTYIMALCMADAIGEQSGLIRFEGPLGAGKSTWIRGMLRHWGWQSAIPSPTYSLLECYTIGSRQIYHMDLYRIGDMEELTMLGLDQLIQPALWLIEWPKPYSGTLLPVADLTLRLEYHEDDNSRRVDLTEHSSHGAHWIRRFLTHKDAACAKTPF